jgi:hypothetical protein
VSPLLVAANTITVLSVPKPSISTNNWFKVESLSSFPPKPSLFLPTASISSIKIIEGAFSLAYANSSLTLLAPKPTNISTNSEPETEKKGTPASPATALAKRVFPVPGGPHSKAPFGRRAPIRVNFYESFRNSTNSVISCLAVS